MKNKNKTIPAKYIPAKYIPAVTLNYDEQLLKTVKRYMTDRYNYLMVGRHILDDLSSSSYIQSLANIFEISISIVDRDFNALGQKITDEKNQEHNRKRFEKEGIQLGLSDTMIKHKLDLMLELREEFIRTRPTKGWDTKKMALHRSEFDHKVFELLGFEIIKYKEVENSGAGKKVAHIANDQWIHTSLFPIYSDQIKRFNQFNISVTWSTNKKRWENNDIFEFTYVNKGLDHSNYLQINEKIINLKN